MRNLKHTLGLLLLLSVGFGWIWWKWTTPQHILADFSFNKITKGSLAQLETGGEWLVPIVYYLEEQGVFLSNCDSSKNTEQLVFSSKPLPATNEELKVRLRLPNGYVGRGYVYISRLGDTRNIRYQVAVGVVDTDIRPSFVLPKIVNGDQIVVALLLISVDSSSDQIRPEDLQLDVDVENETKVALDAHSNTRR